MLNLKKELIFLYYLSKFQTKFIKSFFNNKLKLIKNIFFLYYINYINAINFFTDDFKSNEIYSNNNSKIYFNVDIFINFGFFIV